MKTRKLLSYPALLALILLLSGCASSLVFWNQATEKFDQAAELEMRSRISARLSTAGDTPPPGALPGVDNLFSATTTTTSENPEQLYRMADEKITKALAAPAPLKKESKLANAYTLKALTSWKTGQAEEARVNAAKALQEFENQAEPSPRDKPLAKAIPGLVALDLAADTIKAMTERLKAQAEGAQGMPAAEAGEVIAKARALYDEFVADAANDHSVAGAQKDLDEALELTGENKDLQLYLILSRMTGLKNRFDLWAQIDNFAKRSGRKAADAALRNWISSEEQSYLSDKDAALVQLKALADGGEQSAVYRYWDGVL